MQSWSLGPDLKWPYWNLSEIFQKKIISSQNPNSCTRPGPMSSSHNTNPSIWLCNSTLFLHFASWNGKGSHGLLWTILCIGVDLIGSIVEIMVNLGVFGHGISLIMHILHTHVYNQDTYKIKNYDKRLSLKEYQYAYENKLECILCYLIYLYCTSTF